MRVSVTVYWEERWRREVSVSKVSVSVVPVEWRRHVVVVSSDGRMVVDWGFTFVADVRLEAIDWVGGVADPLDATVREFDEVLAARHVAVTRFLVAVVVFRGMVLHTVHELVTRWHLT